MTLRHELLRAAGLWEDQKGGSRSTVATRIAGDGKFFRRLAAGGDCTTGTYERLMAFFRAEGVAVEDAPAGRPADAVPPGAPVGGVRRAG